MSHEYSAIPGPNKIKFQVLLCPKTVIEKFFVVLRQTLRYVDGLPNCKAKIQSRSVYRVS